MDLGHVTPQLQWCNATTDSRGPLSGALDCAGGSECQFVKAKLLYCPKEYTNKKLMVPLVFSHYNKKFYTQNISGFGCQVLFCVI